MVGEGSSEMQDIEYRDLIKQLADAVSVQAKFANRTWLAMVTVSLFAILPRVPSDGTLVLPFSLGKVDQSSFYLVVFGVLAILTTAFASAHAQQVRAQKLAQKSLDSVISKLPKHFEIHPRDWFDVLRTPSLNRLAPLAQMLRGKYQFFPESRTCPYWLRSLTVVYYGFLKAVSFFVYFGLPVWGLWHAKALVVASGWLRIAVDVGGLVAILALLQVLVSDVIYAAKILIHLWHVDPKEPTEWKRVDTIGKSASK